jgi:hypothetical protein
MVACGPFCELELPTELWFESAQSSILVRREARSPATASNFWQIGERTLCGLEST